MAKGIALNLGLNSVDRNITADGRRAERLRGRCGGYGQHCQSEKVSGNEAIDQSSDSRAGGRQITKATKTLKSGISSC